MIPLDHLAEDDSPEAAILRHIFDIPYAYAPKQPPRFRIEPFKAHVDP